MLEKITIKKGIQLYLLPDSKYKTFLLRAYLFQPLKKETVTKNALLGTMLRQGTEKFPDRLSIVRQTERLYDTQIDADAQKIGELQAIRVDLGGVNPAFLPQSETYWQEALELFGQMLLCPYAPGGAFPEDVLAVEKENLKDRIEAIINEKRGYAMQQLLKTMCEDEPMGIPDDGYKEEVDDISGSALFAQYQEVLNNSPICIFAAGSFDAETVTGYIRDILKDLPEREEELQKPVVIRRAEMQKYKEERLDVVQGKLCMGFRTDAVGNEPGYYPLLVMNSVFGAGAHSKLFNEVREKMSLCYYASSGLSRNKGILMVSAGIEFKNFEVAKEGILKELEKMQAGQITDSEENAAKLALCNAIRAAEDSKVQQIGRALSGILSGDTRTPEEEMAAVMAVTKEDMMAAAKKLTLDTVYFLRGEEEAE